MCSSMDISYKSKLKWSYVTVAILPPLNRLSTLNEDNENTEHKNCQQNPYPTVPALLYS